MVFFSNLIMQKHGQWMSTCGYTCKITQQKVLQAKVAYPDRLRGFVVGTVTCWLLRVMGFLMGALGSAPGTLSMMLSPMLAGDGVMKGKVFWEFPGLGVSPSGSIPNLKKNVCYHCTVTFNQNDHRSLLITKNSDLNCDSFEYKLKVAVDSLSRGMGDIDYIVHLRIKICSKLEACRAVKLIFNWWQLIWYVVWKQPKSTSGPKGYWSNLRRSISTIVRCLWAAQVERHSWRSCTLSYGRGKLNRSQTGSLCDRRIKAVLWLDNLWSLQVGYITHWRLLRAGK